MVPPGFSTGMQFEKKKLGSFMSGTGDMTQFNLTDILASADDIELLDDDVDDDISDVKKEEGNNGERGDLGNEEQVKSECLLLFL